MELELIKISIALIGGGLALYQFFTQTAYLRNRNLSDLWRKFYENDTFMELFANLDNDQNHHLIENTIPSTKLKFLAYLAEVFNTASISQIDEQKSMVLYQWHFYYCFINPKSRNAFWVNILTDDEFKNIETELSKNYWASYYKFAQKCEKMMLKNGDVS